MTSYGASYETWKLSEGDNYLLSFKWWEIVFLNLLNRWILRETTALYLLLWTIYDKISFGWPKYLLFSDDKPQKFSNLSLTLNTILSQRLATELVWYLSYVPPTRWVWHKTFFRWVWAQSRSVDTPNRSKSALFPVQYSPKKGRLRHQAINLASPMRLEDASLGVPRLTRQTWPTKVCLAAW